ncbi:multicopper oxidase domain-containing protein [Roseofilum reptotaenium CS-1145]|uniref:Copper-containing nitrite reductase n=1 Tax=Roseofilum reptotaenium AO1-A TaxID=1925591 RepID=A0A1L9QTL1_9CYAN|nr:MULTISPECIES: multicopper oxidase domain-containing protein [Roseofilum]MBP0028395.1 multicopper oxidase domain-containing protein [Roseofilum sp. Guam]MDB9519006.1 multicopper oxidase domain-containing protein [Roseofilum reptotaenium CS-1145]OJJ26011.1 copper oxidase [Roseofilum reptotaenium AO1-A]
MNPQYSKNIYQQVSRRKLLGFGAASGSLLIASALLKPRISKAFQAIRIPSLPAGYTPPSEHPFDPMVLLREFDYGTVKYEQGKKVREFEVTAKSSPLQLNSVITFISWNLNDRVPGPTFRAKEGERIRIVFHNEGGHSHSMHFHGTHPVDMDGIEPIRHGKTMVYEFDAEPFGVHPYHCHIAPVTRHISKGLYGLLIVDPPEGRVPADEMVMVMGGFDINNDHQNELYAFNGIPNYYRDHPIPVYQNQLIRLYLLNMIEFDPAVTFHIHANMFQIFPTGRTLKSSAESDVITMGTAERHILEFSYKYPGQYMFHPHQDDIAERGCMGFFDVLPV